MANVKILCPKCLGQGLTGDPVVVRCSQCTGTGTIVQDDTQTLNALNAAITGSTNVQLVFTTAPVLSTSVANIVRKGKG